jgi:hypothetical protein
MHPLMARFRQSGVRVVFSGHEHNFQHSRVDDLDYFVSGAAGKLRRGRPDRMREAHTVSWSDTPHFLLVTIDARTMSVRAIGELVDGELADIERRGAADEVLTGPITIAAPA